MTGHRLNQRGFSALEVALFVIVMGLMGGTGAYVYKATQTSPSPSTSATSASTPTKPADNTTPETHTTTAQLQISQWNVTMPLNSSIADADYHLVDNTAWLSTLALDKDSTCYKSSTDRPTFAGITRYALTDKVAVQTSPTTKQTVAASQAVKLDVSDYRQVGTYVYAYELNYTDAPCQSETHDQVNAFTDAFNGLQVVKPSLLQ